MSETQSRFQTNLLTFHNTVSSKYKQKEQRAIEQLSRLQEIKEEENKKRKKLTVHNTEKVKQKNIALMSQRRRELEQKTKNSESHFLNFQAQKQQKMLEKRKEAELRQKHCEEVRAKVNQEFQQKLMRTSEKLLKGETKAEKAKEQRQRDRLLAIEVEAIKRREREQEAKRLLKAEEYKRKKQADEKEKAQLKAQYLRAKKKELQELRKTVRQNAQLYKDKVRQEIDDLRKKNKLGAGKIKINCDPMSPQKMYISHGSCKSALSPLVTRKSLPDISDVKSKGRRFVPSGSYATSSVDEQRGS